MSAKSIYVIDDALWKTYWIKSESLQTFLQVSWRRESFSMRNVKSFFKKEEIQDGKNTTHNCLEVENPLPAQVLIYKTSNDRSNGRTENSTT